MHSLPMYSRINKKRVAFIIPLLAGIMLAHTVAAQNCTINAGVTTKLCPDQAFQLNGTSSGSIAVAPTWSQVGGPAVTIVNASNLTTAITGYAPNNTYKFRLTAKCTDGSLIYNEVTYQTLPATIAKAGTNISACPPSITLAANAPASGETGNWQILGDAHGMSITDPSSPTSTVTIPNNTSGSATFRWTINNSNTCTSYSDIVVSNGGGVTPVSAGPDQNLSNCYTLTQGTTLAASYAGDNTNGQRGTWSLVSGPSNPTFSDIHDNKATISNLVTGTYILRWTVSGPCVNGTDEVQITVPPPTQSVSNAGSATLTFCDGRTSAVLTGGTAGYSDETVTWTKQGGAGAIVSPNASTTTVTGLNGSSSSFLYTITNSVTHCATSGTYTINFTSPPTITAASPVTPLCDSTAVNISYSVTGGDQTLWALVSAPAGSSLQAAYGLNNYTGAASPLRLTGLDKIGTYVIRLKRTTNNGNGGCSDAYTDVNVLISRSPTASNAGTKQVLACNANQTNLAGNVPASGFGAWSQVSGPNGALLADKTNPTTAISGLVPGSYGFRWIITGNVNCPNQQSDVTVVVSSATVTQANAGPDRTVCTTTPITLAANAPALNETGAWTVTPATGVSFSDASDPHAVVTGLAANTSYTFTWTIRNACDPTGSSDQVVITTSNSTGPRQADAGTAQCLPAGSTSFALNGNAPASGETGAWNVITGPNTPTLTNNTAYNTTVTGATNGSYQLEWVLQKSGCAVTRDTVQVTISGPATAANAGTAQQVCGTSGITLNGNVPAVGTGAWTQVEGPGGAVITDPSLANTTVTNLTEGRYVFRWTISNGACASNYSDVRYDISTPPTTAQAGNDQSLCSTTSATLQGNTITAGTGLWSQVSGPGSVTFADASNPATGISNLKMGTYVLRWTSSNGPFCPSSTDDVSIFVTQSAKASTSSQQLCNATTTTLTGNEGSTGTWSQTGGPAATLSANSNNSAIVSGMVPGNDYTFTYTIAAIGACPATTDNTIVHNSAPPSTARAGSDQSLCILGAATSINTTLAATVPATGTGLWTVVNQPSGSTASFADKNAASSAFNNLIPGVYILQWGVSSGYCTANSDVMRITVSQEPSDANAGPDQNNGCSSNITLNGNTPAIGIGTWTQVSGPNTATIDAPNSPTTQVLNTQTGTYVFRWTITNGSCTAKSDDVQVTVTSTPPTTADAGSAVQICNTGASASVSLNGNTPGAGETGAWTVVSATGSTPSFSNPASGTTTVNGLTNGVYLLQWAINLGSCQSTDTVRVTVFDQPTAAAAGTDQSICLYSPNPLTLAATAVTKGSGAWDVVSSPAVHLLLYSVM